MMIMGRSPNYIDKNEYIKLFCYVKLIEKVLSLTHYETLMTLIGYCIIANQL